MTPATTTITNIPQRAHPAVVRAALRSRNVGQCRQEQTFPFAVGIDYEPHCVIARAKGFVGYRFGGTL